MLFSTTSTTASRPSTILPFALLVALLALVHSAAALPTIRSAPAASPFEPLFRRASPQVGPARSLERLRLRRSLNEVFHGRRNAEVVDMKRDLPGPIGAVAEERAAPVANPKAKRSLERRALGLPAIVPNPKTKRSSVTTVVERDNIAVPNPKTRRAAIPSSPVNLRRRSAGLPAVVSNPKKRSLDLQKRAVIEASISVSPSKVARRSLWETVKRALAGSSQDAPLDLARRASDSTFSNTPARIGTVKVVPNPKAPSFSGGGGSSSSSVASSAASTSTATTTTRATTTAQATTTSRATSSAASSSRTTTTSAAPTATGWPTSGSFIAGGYYPYWVEDIMPPEALNYKMFDLINYAFALPTSDYLVEIPSYATGNLKRTVKYAHGNNTKVNIAVGGWSDSVYFSGAVASASRRTKFVQSIVKIVNDYNLDGVDVDWEYPGTSGAPGNQISSSDTANLLKFLKELREALPTKFLSTCTTHQAYIGADGSPLTDVSAFASVLDHILVMNYDVWGASSTPGPNAPLRDDCSGSLQPNANMQSAINLWTKAGMPASKILMGIPAYGYVSSSSAKTLIHKRDTVPTTGLSNRHLANMRREERYMSEGHRWYLDGQAKAEARRRTRRAAKRSKRQRETASLAKRGSVIVCPNNHSGKPCEGITDQNIADINWNPLAGGTNGGGNGNSTGGGDGVFVPGTGPGKVGTGNLSGLEGNQIQFADLINYGVLVKDSTTLEWVGTNGYTRKWDTCSSTPYLYDTSRKVVITYDDPHSLGLKGQLAASNGIGGMLMWDLSGDTSDFQLTQSYRSSMGLAPLGV
ncbi:hypothetical protein JCM10450v2_002918 [Rhodotorula kratochvilovae]